MADNTTPSGNSSALLNNIPRGLIGRKGDLLKPSARLPSLRSPRDLTLSGAIKKEFKPNIPIRRERVKEDGDASSRSSSPAPVKKHKRNTSGRGRGRGGRGGRGRGDRSKDLIQTHSSIFEEGPAERLVRRSTTDGFGRSSDRGDFKTAGSLSMTFRSLSLKKSQRDEEDAKRIAELLNDDFMKDSSLAVDDQYIPVCLPLKTTASSSSSSSSSSRLQDLKDKLPVPDIKIKQEPGIESPSVKIKEEPLDSDDELMSVDSKEGLRCKVAGLVKGSEAKKSKLPLFSRRDSLEGCLLFFQLPDSLPGLPPSEDDDTRYQVHVSNSRTTSAGSSTAQTKETETASTECTLKNLPEGFLGKLQIRKSGKTELRLGNIILDVSVGTPCGFLQDVVSVKAEDGHQDMVNLGPIKHRIICTPNLQSLLDGT